MLNQKILYAVTTVFTGYMDKHENEEFADSDKIITDVINSIRRQDGIDAELLDILTKHITKLSPADDAVEQAISEIQVLATRRSE